MNNLWRRYISYFPTENKVRDVASITKFIESIANQTIQFVDEDRALLDGSILKYTELLQDENLPLDSTTADEVVEQLSRYFQRTIQWEKAETMINITPPANLLSIASVAYASLFNPNFAQDESSGYLLGTELAVIKFLSQLAGWDEEKAGGVFTFGGKGINLYAGKIGIMKAVPHVREEGICNSSIVIISNEKSHPCHVEICDWLGIGRNSCLVLPTARNGQLDLAEFESSLRNQIISGKKIGCIIINGGTTNEVIIDPIKHTAHIRDQLVDEFNLDYVPHIHVDSVIGWAWLFFKFYDFDENPLGMTRVEIRKIKSMQMKIKELQYADSFGVDFHKTGFCPYVSSCIMVKKKDELQALGNKPPYEIETLQFGEYAPFEWTLELTRSSNGPISAYVAFKLFGVRGFQTLIYQIFSNGEYIRYLLNSQDDFDVINNDTEGIATLFVVLPPSNQLHYIDYVNGEVERIDELLSYNQQFFLFLLEKYECKEIGIRITFSKSYKPYGCSVKTGCLKIYQTSPVASKEAIDRVINQMILYKRYFDDRSDMILIDKIRRPSDFVYRD